VRARDTVKATSPAIRLWGASVGTYLLLAAILAGNALWLNGGHFQYLLDDAYIHLSMARNLVESGTYGVVAGSYQSASSSPAWTLLLAALGAPNISAIAAIPLVLNLVFSVLLLLVFWVSQDDVVTNAPAPFPLRFLAALLPVFLLLPSLTMAGMEAILQSLVVLLQLWVLLRVLHGGGRPRETPLLLLLTGAAVLVRLEDLFVAAGCLLAVLVFGREAFPRVIDRGRVAAAIGLAATVPAAGIAAVNLINGQALVPNSVLAKTALLGGAVLPLAPAGSLLSKLGQDHLLLVVLAASLLLLLTAAITRHGSTSAPAALALVTAATLHLALAAVGWYDRYQEYLVVAGLWLMTRLAGEIRWPRGNSMAFATMLVLVIVAFPSKAVVTIFTPTASNNIYLQQHQMGRFLARYYNGRGVVVNDIGEVSNQHRGALLDLFGLGSYRVLAARRAGAFSSSFVSNEVTRIDAPVAVVYSDYWRRQIPQEWTLVGSWHISHAAGNLGSSTVDFWATNSNSVDELRRHLWDDRAELPAGEGLEMAPRSPN